MQKNIGSLKVNAGPNNERRTRGSGTGVIFIFGGCGSILFSPLRRLSPRSTGLFFDDFTKADSHIIFAESPQVTTQLLRRVRLVKLMFSRISDCCMRWCLREHLVWFAGLRPPAWIDHRRQQLAVPRTYQKRRHRRRCCDANSSRHSTPTEKLVTIERNDCSDTFTEGRREAVALAFYLFQV
jgi:hypothetical protein